MAIPFVGRNGTIGIGRESTHGTAVSRTNWIRRTVSANGNRKPEFRPSPNLSTSSATGATSRSHYQVVEAPDGEFEVEATYENIGIILRLCLGAVSTSGSGPYTHDYTIDDLESYTLEMIRGNATNSDVFEGVKSKGMTLRGDAETPMRLRVPWRAEMGASRASAGAPSFGSGNTQILGHHAGTLGFNSATYSFIDYELTLDNALIEYRQLGSLLRPEPAEGIKSVRFKVTLVYTTDALQTALLANTQGDLTLAFTSGSQSLTITIQNAFITMAEEPMGDTGIIRQTVEFIGEGDGTDHGLKITVVNGNSSGEAN
jgi:hypothetical protein